MLHPIMANTTLCGKLSRIRRQPLSAALFADDGLGVDFLSSLLNFPNVDQATTWL